MDLIYTSSPYIELGKQLVFENISRESPITINYGDGLIETFYNSTFITHIYNTPGTKTVTVTAASAVSVYPNFINVIQVDEYDPNIVRVFESTNLVLPYGCPLIPPNEWVIQDTINIVFEKFYGNLTYLEEASKMYNNPPTQYIGWFGSAIGEQPEWKTYSNSLSSNYITIASSLPVGICKNISDIKTHDGLVWIANKTESQTLSGFDVPTIMAVKDTLRNEPLIINQNKSREEYFGEITSLAFDSQNHLFVLDSKYNEISVFQYVSSPVPKLEYLFKWGGAESYLAKTKFVQASDLQIDLNDNVYVVDTGNSTIKKFSTTGIWISDIALKGMAPLKIVVDHNDVLQVLTTNKVYRFDNHGKFIDSYDIRNTDNSAPVSICKSNSPGFIYIAFEHSVLKFTETGTYAGRITGNIEPYIRNASNFTGLGQDSNNNLYIATGTSIIKYIDATQIFSVKADTTSLMWPLSSMLIDTEEFIQDWVYNRNFARLWDNMEIFRRSIFDKFESYEIESGVNSLRTVSFLVSDELYFKYDKEDIIIGVNELVTADVLNRVIGMMCNNQKIIVELLTEKQAILPPIPFDFCWSWFDVSSDGQNGITWEDTACDPAVDWATKWSDAKSDCCAS